MSYVLVRDGEDGPKVRVHVYNNVTSEAADLLVFLASHLDIVSVYRSDDVYDPAIAQEFRETGEVHECSPITTDYNAFGESGTFVICRHCERNMDHA